MQYIIKLAQRILAHCETRNDLGDMFKLLPALTEELDRLDPRDFLPDGQFEFVLARVEARKWSRKSSLMGGTDSPAIAAMAKAVLQVLAKYGGDGSRAERRSFDFIRDADLRHIIERDYRELTLSVFSGGAWKSTVVLSGSILEAILFDQLTRDAATQARTEASPRAPCDRAGNVKDLAAGDWRLIDLIDVAVDIGLIPSQRAASIDQVLRDYRNFVHPKKELRAQHPCTEAEAMMAMGALDGVCNILCSS